MLEVHSVPEYSHGPLDVLGIFCEESMTGRVDTLLQAIDREIFADFKRNLDFPFMKYVQFLRAP